MCNNSLFLDHHPVRPRVFLHEQTVAANQPTDHPSQDFELDMFTSAALSSTSLTHNSGTTFRSWVSIGLAGFVDAIPAGKNADQCFDHCSCAGGLRRTHRSPVANIFSHWFVCSGCKTCLFHCCHDRKQACSRSSPFGLLIPEPFPLWQLEKSWIFAVGRQVSFIYTLLPSAVVQKSFALEPSDSVKGWFVKQSTGMTVSPAPESTTRGFGNSAQVFC